MCRYSLNAFIGITFVTSENQVDENIIPFSRIRRGTVIKLLGCTSLG